MRKQHGMGMIAQCGFDHFTRINLHLVDSTLMQQSRTEHTSALVKADGTPSVALERRLTAALEEYRKKPSMMIVCGAQGSDEPRAEGDVMRDWLVERGVNEKEVIAETGSFNTRQNLGYAQSFMDDQGLTQALVVTSDYHVARALALCKEVGITATGKGSPSKPEYFIKNHLREGLSWVKFMWESMRA